jgi:hypothetical protein
VVCNFPEDRLFESVGYFVGVRIALSSSSITIGAEKSRFVIFQLIEFRHVRFSTTRDLEIWPTYSGRSTRYDVRDASTTKEWFDALTEKKLRAVPHPLAITAGVEWDSYNSHLHWLLPHIRNELPILLRLERS